MSRTAGGAFQLPYLLVRATSDPPALVPDLRRLGREIEPHAALDNVDRLTGRLSVARKTFMVGARETVEAAPEKPAT